MTKEKVLVFLKGKIHQSAFEKAELWLEDNDKVLGIFKRRNFCIEDPIFPTQYCICINNGDYIAVNRIDRGLSWLMNNTHT